MATKASTVIRKLFVYFWNEGNRVPWGGWGAAGGGEGAINSRAGTDAQADEGLSSVFRVSVKTTYVLHSLTQGVLGPQMGTRPGTSTRILEVRGG